MSASLLFPSGLMAYCMGKSLSWCQKHISAGCILYLVLYALHCVCTLYLRNVIHYLSCSARWERGINNGSSPTRMPPKYGHNSSPIVLSSQILSLCQVYLLPLGQSDPHNGWGKTPDQILDRKIKKKASVRETEEGSRTCSAMEGMNPGSSTATKGSKKGKTQRLQWPGGPQADMLVLSSLVIIRLEILTTDQSE